ncbi:MAG: hypothetical protein ACI4WS_02855 [Oscillospiraceae bacterium]
MNCCLWFNRRKISSAADIADNMDLAALRGYFLGGSLATWLREHDGGDYEDMLEQLDPADPDLNNRLLAVFDKNPKQVQSAGLFVGNTSAACGVCGVAGSFKASGSFGSFGFGGSFGSFGASGAFNSGSFAWGSYALGSFTGFRLWEWEWEWRFGGSFRGSFRGLGSFGGSFGGIGFGSYVFGSGAYLLGSFRSGAMAGFGGSYIPGGNNSWLTSDEYDRIMYECLRRCPLDSFGYGIHIV